MDELHADGAAAGFFCYPLDTLREEEGSQKIFDFRDKLEEALAAGDGPEVLTLTGGATGLFCGYVDFIAWDIRAALKMAREFFEDSHIPWAVFHTFRREAGAVTLKDADVPDEEPNTEEQEEALSEIEHIPYTPQNAEAFFQQLEQWNDGDEYTKCIQAIEAVPEGERGYQLSLLLGRAYSNLAVLGDRRERQCEDDNDVDQEALARALKIFESIREEGQNDPYWYSRIAYALYMAENREAEALEYARKWLALDPDNENAKQLVDDCVDCLEREDRRELFAHLLSLIHI